MENDIQEVLIAAQSLARRNAELGAQLVADYQGKQLTVIVVSSGALMFASDLVRHVSLPLQLDVISVKSYHGTRSSRKVNILSQLHVSLRGRDVLIVDDIFDTGLTMTTIMEALQSEAPASLKTCVLLQKRCAREIDWVPDYVGFEVDDHFVVGYGLDFNETYRNLPYVGVLHSHLYGDEA